MTDKRYNHWLVVTAREGEQFGNPQITGCHCGFVAHESDFGYGDSVIAHLAGETLRWAADAALPRDRASHRPMKFGQMQDWLRGLADEMEGR